MNAVYGWAVLIMVPLLAKVGPLVRTVAKAQVGLLRPWPHALGQITQAGTGSVVGGWHGVAVAPKPAVAA